MAYPAPDPGGATWLDRVRAVFAQYGVPEYVWLPIMYMESGGRPDAEAVTAKERSIGLFQINVKAHPQFAGLDLKDPVVNAQVAARYFIAPAWEKARYLPSPADQAEYVWRYGIRPDWSLVERLGRDEQLRQYATQLARAQTGPNWWDQIKQYPQRIGAWFAQLWARVRGNPSAGGSGGAPADTPPENPPWWNIGAHIDRLEQAAYQLTARILVYGAVLVLGFLALRNMLARGESGGAA